MYYQSGKYVLYYANYRVSSEIINTRHQFLKDKSKSKRCISDYGMDTLHTTSSSGYRSVLILQHFLKYSDQGKTSDISNDTKHDYEYHLLRNEGKDG